MECFELTKKEYSLWASCIPPEIYSELEKGNSSLRVIGATFLEEPQGALVWECTGHGNILHSIYVKPMARRLGLGKSLMRQLSVQMQEKQCPQLTFTYTNSDEHPFLLPFLTACGALVDEVELPLGSTTLGYAADALTRARITRPDARCRMLTTLTTAERALCTQWTYQELGEPVSFYLNREPASYAVIEQGILKGLLLLEEIQGTLRLSYCYAAPEETLVLAQLLATATAALLKKYPAQTPLEMILATPQSEKLYHRLLGEIHQSISLCYGSFSPQPLLLFD